MENLEPIYFYFQLPIYFPIKIDDKNLKEFWHLINFKAKVDYYNPYLQENSTFQVVPCNYQNADYFSKYGGMNYSRLECVRTKQNFYFYYFFDTTTGDFMKIGQYTA